jgi:hypothetical protein
MKSDNLKEVIIANDNPALAINKKRQLQKEPTTLRQY